MTVPFTAADAATSPARARWAPHLLAVAEAPTRCLPRCSLRRGRRARRLFDRPDRALGRGRTTPPPRLLGLGRRFHGSLEALSRRLAGGLLLVREALRCSGGHPCSPPDGHGGPLESSHPGQGASRLGYPHSRKPPSGRSSVLNGRRGGEAAGQGAGEGRGAQRARRRPPRHIRRSPALASGPQPKRPPGRLPRRPPVVRSCPAARPGREL